MIQTPWLSDVEISPRFEPLKQDLMVDVVVIGAGITGISTAYHLSKEGKKVALIEKGLLGKDGATAYTTAFLTQIVDTDLVKLVPMFGKKKAQQIWQSHKDAITQIEKNVETEKIECEFTRCNGYIYTDDQNQIKSLEEEIEEAHKLDFTEVSFAQLDALPFSNVGSMKVSEQGKFHPLKYVLGLVKKCKKNGVQIFEKTEATKIEEKDGEVIVETKHGAIRVQYAVVATYSPFYHPLPMYFKAGEYKSYVYEVEIEHGIFEEALYEDTANPYHYFRIDSKKDFDRMIIGGEDHRSDVPVDESKNFNALKEYLEKIMQGRPYKILRKWSGPILEPIDGLAFIGAYKKNSHLLVTHGYSGTGMTYGTIAAQIFTDTILGRKNEYASLYDASRLPDLKQLSEKGKDYGQEFIGGAVKNTFTK